MEIEGLYKATAQDKSRVIETLIDAFRDYPKMDAFFPNAADQKAAMDATLHFYVPYALCYGAVFSLDEQIQEALCLVHSDQMDCTEEQFEFAGSYSKDFEQNMNRLTKKQQKQWWAFFDEFDRLQETVDLPDPHLYIDFLGVKKTLQNQGRGRKLMQAVCNYADSVGLPLMLFNTPDLTSFYETLGFCVIDTVSSEEFGFSNAYMLRFP